MRRRIPLALALPSLTLLAASLQAAETPAPPPRAFEDAPAAKPVPEEPAGFTSVVVTPRLFLFDYFDGVGEDRTHFLERYDYREALGGDTRSGVFADVDLDVTVNDGDRDKFVLERRGFGEHNHRGSAKYNDDKLGVYGSYTHYRSATGGIDYLFNPNTPELTNNGTTTGGTVPLAGTPGFAHTFTDASGTTIYHIDRTTYAAGFKLKPAALADKATIEVDYRGYRRDGNKFAPFLLDGGGGGGGGGGGPDGGGGTTITGQERWRGISLNVDERMNRVGLTLSASPQKRFEVAYEVSFEDFSNNAAELQLQRDITDPAGLAAPLNPTASLLYVPDTKLVSHGIRASKTFNERVVVAAGYGASWLKQDSFSQFELDAGHTKGRIANDNAYLTANALVSPAVSVEGHIKYANRDNDSTFTDALVTTTTAPRIDRINSLDYGVAASWRPGFLGSNLTLGWRHLDKERDLTFSTSAQAILPAQTLYREDTVSDEVYLKWTARPAMGWHLRITPSFTWADETALVTEPEKAFKLKSTLSHTLPAGWVVSGFYDYTDKQNGNNTFTDGTGGLTYNQDVDSTLHSAGVTINGAIREDANAHASLYWARDDISSYLFRTDVERWNPGVTFTLLDKPNYQVDSYVFGVGGDWEYNEKLKLDGSYTFSRSHGDVASGEVLTSLTAATGTIDAAIDNTLHSFALGANYQLNEKALLRVNYVYDHYSDDTYDLLSGGVHLLAVGVSYALK